MDTDTERTETHSLRGPIDRPVLFAIRDVFTAEEPLATAQLDDYLNPTILEITFTFCGQGGASRLKEGARCVATE